MIEINFLILMATCIQRKRERKRRHGKRYFVAMWNSACKSDQARICSWVQLFLWKHKLKYCVMLVTKEYLKKIFTHLSCVNLVCKDMAVREQETRFKYISRLPPSPIFTFIREVQKKPMQGSLLRVVIVQVYKRLTVCPMTAARPTRKMSQMREHFQWP